MKQKKTRDQFIGSGMLLITAFIWGTAFVAQSKGMEHLGPFAFNGVRNCIAILFTAVVMCMKRYAKRGKSHPLYEPANARAAAKGGILCGLCLCIASLFQQIGIQYTTVGKAGFLTAIYIVLVPLIGMLLGRRPRMILWFGVAAALAGIYLLSVKEKRFSIELGDAFILISALFFAIQILLVEHYVQKMDGVLLSCMQFIVSAILSLALALVFEQPTLTDVLHSLGPLLYAGVLSSGVAYTLQIIGQKRVSATVACLIMSLESVIAAAAGVVLLKEPMGIRELIGSGLVLLAVVSVQIPVGKKTADS